MKDKCVVCNGRRYTKQKYMKVEYDELCSNCCGTGKVEWINNIIAKRNDNHRWKNMKIVNLSENEIVIKIPDKLHVTLHPDIPFRFDGSHRHIIDDIFGNEFIAKLVKEQKLYLYEVYS